MQNTPREMMKPFHLTTTGEICEDDKKLILRIMKPDPRDRPSAKELSEDAWFRDIHSNSDATCNLGSQRLAE